MEKYSLDDLKTLLRIDPPVVQFLDWLGSAWKPWIEQPWASLTNLAKKGFNAPIEGLMRLATWQSCLCSDDAYRGACIANVMMCAVGVLFLSLMALWSAAVAATAVVVWLAWWAGFAVIVRDSRAVKVAEWASWMQLQAEESFYGTPEAQAVESVEVEHYTNVLMLESANGNEQNNRP